jgi:NDP-sugar pyrophosphorylase family protein
VISVAVVMAAGIGKRLRPLTESYAKPVLPMDGRPVLATLLRELAAAGVRRVALVTGHLAEQVEALAGDGSGFGLELRAVSQPDAVGSADAVRRGLGVVDAPVLVTAADTVYSTGDVGRFAAASAAAGADGAIAVRRSPPPSPPHRAAVRIESGRVTRVLDDDPSNPLAAAPLWMVGPRIAARLDDLPGPPFELSLAFQRAIDDGSAVAGVEIGSTRDLTHPIDLVRENFDYLRAL